MKGVDDALRRLDGVDHIEIDLQTNLVTITPSPRVALDLSDVPRAIDRAGFRPGKMRLRCRGALEQRGGTLMFRLRNWPAALSWSGRRDLVTADTLTGRVDNTTAPPTLML